MIEDERFPRCHMSGCQLFFGHVPPCSPQYTTADRVSFCAEQVFEEMGSGHSEIVYESCMAVELQLNGFQMTTRQVPCSLIYKGFSVGVGYIDILVEESLIIELKAVAKLTPKDVQQVRKYLTAMGLENGLLINFGNSLEIVEVKKGEHEQTPSSED